jgi:TPR repeat protein
LAAIVAAGCGAGKAIRPADPTASSALGAATVAAPTDSAAPLVVDWNEGARGDLEEIVNDGKIVIVAWDSKGFRLLRKCHLDGDYGYVPISYKTKVLHLSSQDEVMANLPLGGLGIVGKVGGDLEQQATIDIALAMVGKRRTTYDDVTQDQLKGQCTEATHFVRAMTVGAFAMATGTKAKASAAAEIFGASLGGSSGSEKDVANHDGKLDVCDKTTGEEQKPMGNCNAVLRLELEPIAAGSATKKGHDDIKAGKPDAVPTCGPGLVWADDACVSAKKNVAHACKEGDGPDCQAQCDAGDVTSCWRYGWYLLDKKKDPKAATVPYAKACDADHPGACWELGLSYEELKDFKSAEKAYDHGCKIGQALACRYLGDFHQGKQLGKPDPGKAIHYYSRACDAGDAWSCTEAAYIFADGAKGVQPNPKKAALYSKRGCLAGDADGCKLLADIKP